MSDVTARRERPIEVYRLSDATVEFRIDGEDLTGATVELWRKALASDPDPAAPLCSTATGTVALTAPTLGRCEVTLGAADVPAAGAFAYHLDRVDSGRRTVLAHGPMYVLNR